MLRPNDSSKIYSLGNACFQYTTGHLIYDPIPALEHAATVQLGAGFGAGLHLQGRMVRFWRILSLQCSPRYCIGSHTGFHGFTTQ